MRTIESPQNPQIKSVAKLRTAKGRAEQGLIIIDGKREVLRAASAGVEITQLLLPESQADAIGHWWSSATADNPKSTAAELLALSDRAFSKVAFGNRQEVVAIALTPQRSLAQLSLGQSPIIAVLAEIEKPGNIGAILRSSDAAGLDAVVVVNPVSDLFNPNTIRSSLGTVFTQPLAEASFEAYRSWIDPRQLRHYQARLDPTSISHTKAEYHTGCAIVLGGEAEGLSAAWDELQPSQYITIPMRGSADSLNVSAAAAVLFYEATRK